DQAFDNAAVVAEWLSSHPRVEKVAYLGALPAGSAAADVVVRQCSAYGATFSFIVRGGEAAAFQGLDHLKGFKLAVSLGGTESLACHPASTTHSGVPAAEREALGITEGMIRLSIGLEAPQDLIADLDAALASLEPAEA